MRPLKTKKDFPPLAVYDIEATSWTNVKIVCHLDEYGNERSFKSIHDYLIWLLTDFEGERVWAHFGSGYDNRFLVEEVCKWPGSSFKAIMSGGLPIIFEVQNDAYQATSTKNGKERNRRVTLLDSFRWLPTSLASVGKSIGEEKLDVDRTRIEKLSWAELEEYCMQDCRVLLKGMQKFRQTVLDQGGSFAVTSASIASGFIRSDTTIDWSRFFDKEDGYRSYSGTHYERMEPLSKPGMIQADEFSESAYFGGRCEVFRRGKVDKPLYYYDIASAYPWAMTQDLPFYFRGFRAGAAWEDKSKLKRILNSCGICDARIYIPRGTFEIPPIPVHASTGKVVFPEGKFMGRWTCAELKALFERGKGKGVRIDITCFAEFEPVPFAKELVDKFYALRKEAKENGDEGTSLILKILMNSAYGKLAQQLEQSSYVYGEAYEFDIEQAQDEGKLHPVPTMPGVFEIQELAEGPFRHVAAGAYITSLARLKLLQGMETALEHGANVYYCDTDSIIVDKEIPGWGTSKDLGTWEIEHKFKEGEFLCLKVYRAICADDCPCGKPGSYVLKAKGANLKSRLENGTKEANKLESLRRWLVYSQEISKEAKQELASQNLTEKDLIYYGETEAGLKGWRTSLREGTVSCNVAKLARSAKNPDQKRDHGATGSMPLYMTGDPEEDDGYLDLRTMDPESLIEMELAEHESWLRDQIAESGEL